MDELQSVIADLENRDKQLEATSQIRKLLSISNNPPIREVLDAGALPKLIEVY